LCSAPFSSFSNPKVPSNPRKTLKEEHSKIFVVWHFGEIYVAETVVSYIASTSLVLFSVSTEAEMT
jgi:hypothetical protein